MGGAILFILLDTFLHGSAKHPRADHTSGAQGSVHGLAAALASNLIDRSTTAWPTKHKDLEQTTLVKTRRNDEWSAKGKNVLITGASSGIGRELALRYAMLGANLVLLARRVDLLEQLAQECSQHGIVALPLKCDVTDHSACSEAVNVAVARLGTLDVVICNAGVSQGCYFEDIQSLDDGEYMLKVNLMGTANLLHCALPLVPKHQDSRLVAISSVAGVVGVPFRTFYCMSKWGLHGFCNSLRTELLEAYGNNAPKVIVSCPPEVDTDLNTGRLAFGAGKPAEFSKTVARPVSVAADSILAAVKDGSRLSFFERKHKVLAKTYGLIPTRIDAKIIQTVKSTQIHPRIQSKP